MQRTRPHRATRPDRACDHIRRLCVVVDFEGCATWARVLDVDRGQGRGHGVGPRQAPPQARGTVPSSDGIGSTQVDGASRRDRSMFHGRVSCFLPKAFAMRAGFVVTNRCMGALLHGTATERDGKARRQTAGPRNSFRALKCWFSIARRRSHA